MKKIAAIRKWINSPANPNEARAYLLCIGILAAVMILSLSTGCTTLGPDGTRVYDPITSARMVNAFQAPVRETITRVIRNSPGHADKLASYFRSVGNIVCRAHATGQVDADQLLAEVDRQTAPLVAGIDPIAVTVKNAIFVLLKDFALQGKYAKLDPQKWPMHVLEAACLAVDGGLVDAGHPGVDWKQ